MDFLNNKYSEKEIRKAINQLSKNNWYNISEYQTLSEDFIREFQDKVDWSFISRYQKLSEDFIRQFQDKVNWNMISFYQKLSEDFIREFQDKVDWYNISCNQKLSEDFIREFQDKVDWNCISKYQKLSEDFIREFQSKLNWYYICYNEELQVLDKFCEDFDKKLCYDNIWRINGEYHRTLGPAIDNKFWYRGQKIEVSNMKQYKHWLKLRIFS
jgi:hypothetical protein